MHDAPFPLEIHVSDRERPKRSWREIDSGRDGSRRSASPARPAQEGADAKASKAHRAALDALFAKGEVGKYAEKMGLSGATRAAEVPKVAAPVAAEVAPAVKVDPKEQDRLALRKKILDGTSRDAVGRLFDRYAKAYGMPKDWELLERGLEHPREARLAEVLGEIESLLVRDPPRRTRTLDSRLRFIAETHDDRELRARAEALRAKF